MARPRKYSIQSITTTVAIENYLTVKEFCAARGLSVRELVNNSIKLYIMQDGSEHFNVKYFKGIDDDDNGWRE
ncbi:MAG: hypothetical protein ACTSRU_11615 [Candidatus Hodarchaeales archaeon]